MWVCTNFFWPCCACIFLFCFRHIRVVSCRWCAWGCSYLRYQLIIRFFIMRHIRGFLLSMSMAFINSNWTDFSNFIIHTPNQLDFLLLFTLFVHIVPLLQLPRALSPPPSLLPLPRTLSLSLNRERTGIATGRPPLRVVNLARMPQNLPAQWCCCCNLLLNWLFLLFLSTFHWLVCQEMPKNWFTPSSHFCPLSGTAERNMSPIHIHSCE